MTQFTALFDACVLYPHLLRHLLVYLALTDLFRGRWTEQIQDEWIRNVLKDFPDIPPERLAKTRMLMNENIREGVISGYESLIQALQLPDPDDRHVLAAAIHAKAEVIVTTNLKDFPLEALKPHGIQAQHPDEFIAYLIDLDPTTVCTAVRLHRTSLNNPPKTVETFLIAMEQQGLVISAGMLRQMSQWV